MKAKFERKANKDQLVPQDEFIIEKSVIVTKKQFELFLNDLLADFKVIDENKELMYTDSNGVWHCIFITANESDFGILVQSEGYGWARYSAYLSKTELERKSK
jgi:hypothetical protein